MDLVKLNEFIDKFYNPENDFLRNLRKEGERENIPIILRETENYLKTLLSIKKPSKILEIGTAIGYSAGFFATILPECHIDTIEKNKSMYEKALKNIAAMGKNDNVKVYLGDGEDVMKEILAPQKISYDFIFIDGAKSQYNRFFIQGSKMCNKGAIIICDNILQRGMTLDKNFDIYGKHKTSIRRMWEFLEFLKDYEDGNTTILSLGDGLSITEITKDIN